MEEVESGTEADVEDGEVRCGWLDAMGRDRTGQGAK